MSSVCDVIDDNNNDGTKQCNLNRLGSNCCSNSNTNNAGDAHLKKTNPPNSDLNSLYQCNGTTPESAKELLLNGAESDNSSESNKENQNVIRAVIPKLKKSNSHTLRGILKYPPGWRRRTVSESYINNFDASSNSDDYGYYGTSLDSPEILFEFDVDDVVYSEEAQDFHKPKKCVTFSEKSSTFVFRRGSSILGQRQKNQKKAKKKRERRNRESSDNENSCSGCSDAESSDAYDSVSDVSCSSSCESSECSGDEGASTAFVEKETNIYKEESDSSKSNRKNRRKRNRKNKQDVRTFLETGCYDSD